MEIAQKCHGYVGSDLDLLVQEAGLCGVKRLMARQQQSTISQNTTNHIIMSDLDEALHKIKPRLVDSLLASFQIVKFSMNFDQKVKLKKISYNKPIKNFDSKNSQGL